MSPPSFWTARSAGERALLAGIGAVVLGVLLFTFAWLPLERARTRIAAELPGLRASVAEMRSQADEARALRAMPARSAAGGAPLADLIASGALAQGLPGARFTAVDAKRLKVAVEDASWTRLVEWLAALGAAHGLAVEEATVDALAATGRVRASLVLAAP
jgi:type II secretory pathway component PulM